MTRDLEELINAAVQTMDLIQESGLTPNAFHRLERALNNADQLVSDLKFLRRLRNALEAVVEEDQRYLKTRETGGQTFSVNAVADLARRVME